MRKFAKWGLRLIGLTTLGLFIWTLLPDGLTVLLYSPHPAAIERDNGGHKTAFVFFTGVQSSSEALSAPMIGLWEQHADVVVVEYNRVRFDGRQTAYDTYQKLVQWGYPQVILDGASMGGLVATDVIDYDRALGGHIKFAVIMQDAPMDANDLHMNGAGPLTNIWWPGAVTNSVGTGLFWHFNFNPPPRDQLGTDVNDQQLAAEYSASSNWPLSGWVGQIRYISRHSPFELNQYAGIPLVVLESQNDAVVKPTATRWSPVFGGATVIQVPEASHIDFVEHPDQWREAFTQAFAALPPGW